MDVTCNIIIDLLPLYVAGECSQDTKRFVDEYLDAHPDLRQQVKQLSQNPLPNGIQERMTNNDEMKSLKKAKRLLRLRSTVLAFAIFFSLCPFSFGNIDGKSFFMITDSPKSAMIYGSIGIVFWVIYFIMRRRMSDL
jgi:hypothetical protein